MEEIIAPISKEILKAELSEDKRLRFTNKSHNEILCHYASGFAKM